MAEAPFSDEDSGPSIKLFSPSPSTIPEIEGAAGFKYLNQDDESLAPSLLEELSSEPGGSDKAGDSDDIEQQISESLDQLSTSPNEHITCELSTKHSDNNGNDLEQPRRQARIGNHYQARIPKYLGAFNTESLSSSSSEMSYDELLWDPLQTDGETVEIFLKGLSALTKLIIPVGNHIRDDEQALYVLQQNDYDVNKALEVLKIEMATKMCAWTEEECKNFETGLLNFGKNFFLIQKRKVTTRQIKELVQFYYLWKKSERYDLFARRIRAGKKKYVLNPGISDLMNKYVHGWKDNCAMVNSDVQFILTDVKKESHQSDMQY